jgi:hypothetical protein
MRFASIFIFVLIASLLAGQSLAAGSSASYKITTENVGNTRDRQLSAQSSASFALNAGFFRSAYFAGVTPFLAPVVIAVTPGSAANTGPVNITNLGGANFQPGATVRLSKSGQTDINAASVVVVNTGKITCTFDLTGAAGGAWDVTVTNSDGRSGSLAGAFTVTFAAPAITGVTPASGTNNGPINITALSGTNFRSGAAVRLTQTGQPDVVATAVAVPSSGNITCTFDLTGKASGLWDVIVTNSDGQNGTLTAGFKVETPTVSVVKPVVSSANPFNPSVGKTSINYTLSKDANIVIYIYNMRGERVWQYAAPAGESGGTTGNNSVVWDGLTAFQSFASEGVYIVEVTSTDGGGFHVLSRTKVAVVR